MTFLRTVDVIAGKDHTIRILRYSEALNLSQMEMSLELHTIRVRNGARTLQITILKKTILYDFVYWRIDKKPLLEARTLFEPVLHSSHKKRCHS